jgi:hypothetical protein
MVVTKAFYGDFTGIYLIYYDIFKMMCGMCPLVRAIEK